MKITQTFPFYLTLFASALICASASAAELGGARFEGADLLLRPIDYREWVFVGSSLGLRYSEDDSKSESERMEFKNIYINRDAYRAFLTTGKFPEGTILILETAKGETKQERGLRGSFQKEFEGLSAAVKDSMRFKDGWAYFSFRDSDGKLKEKAKPFGKTACYDCHRQHGATDNVFTQFYPVLRAAAQRPE